MTVNEAFAGYNRNQQTAVPFEHYAQIYKSLDPMEAARRCGLSFNEGAFGLRIMGEEHRVTFPDFRLIDSSDKEIADPYERILFIHYLCEGKYFSGQGKRLSYNEIPWGNVYYRNFEGRCLKRLAFTFGKDIPAFKEMIKQNPSLHAEPLVSPGTGTSSATKASGDAAYRFEFINGLYISLLLWGADDEFPPSAQVLFDDNFVFAFTAEDIAGVGDVLINRLKKLNAHSRLAS